MKQLLESYKRVNEAMQQNGRHFVSHIFLDNGVRGTRPKKFALQLIDAAKKTLGKNFNHML